VEHEEQVSKVSIVGTGMRRTRAWRAHVAALAAENLNVENDTTGDIKISVLVAKTDGPRALRAVPSSFRSMRCDRRGRAQSAERRARRIAHPHPRPAPSAASLSSVTQQLSSMEDIVVSRTCSSVWTRAHHRLRHAGSAGQQPGHLSDGGRGGILVDMIVQNQTGPGRGDCRSACRVRTCPGHSG